MSWAEALFPVPMQRVAVVVPRSAERDALVCLAEAGCVDLDRTGALGSPGQAPSYPDRRAAAELADTAPAPGALEQVGRAELVAGEEEVVARLSEAVRRRDVAALAGWCPRAEVGPLGARLAELGGALVPMAAPRGIDPPTALRRTGPVRGACSSLVTTYGTPPYPDLDPSWGAAALYAAMFGMMFGDVGHGALLVLTAFGLAVWRPRRLAAWHGVWPLVAAAGASSIVAGLAYGEFFGPTGVLPVLWLAPLHAPVRLLLSAVAVGAVLLFLAYVAGMVNRWRERGLSGALYSLSGMAGGGVFLGLAGVAAGAVGHLGWLVAVGAAVAVTGAALAAVGLYAGTDRGVSGLFQTGVQLFDGVVRILSNVVSFARLAAFGLTHAALGAVVWAGVTGLARHGPAGLMGAVALFAVGNALVFTLEALVAGVQALRLEYFELFSRVFEGQGRPFRPWRLPVRRSEVVP
ncbi:V-type ATPase 116kDa subunit family protein [Streptomyces noursei]|uniref:V-type ATPase 116kDa subunit family protein n=1 Tax=Streptomyces noursei TaxID=1971 RepID=UPI001965AB00|nr:V-type ATPase 116kDa subunit family protein [Streptomyces noursei]QRX90231.1 ATPase [Streptomyces noursei]